MKRCAILWGLGGAVAATLLTVTLVSSQPPATSGPASPGFPSTAPPGVLVPSDPFSRPTAPHSNIAPPVAPPTQSIDDLLAKLDTIKAQKAALEKAEKETIATLVEKFKQQQERMRKLGIPIEGENVWNNPQANCCR